MYPVRGRPTYDGNEVEPQNKVTFALVGMEVTLTLTAIVVPARRGMFAMLYVKFAPYARPWTSGCEGAAEKLFQGSVGYLKSKLPDIEGDPEAEPVQLTQMENFRGPDMLICAIGGLPRLKLRGFPVKFFENGVPGGGGFEARVPPCPDEAR